MLKDGSITFNADDIQLILSGRKVQTSRIVKKAPTTAVNHRLITFDNGWNWQVDQEGLAPTMHRDLEDPMQCPYGEIGNRVWVRESFGKQLVSLGGTPHERLVYKADNPDAVGMVDCNGKKYPVQWKLPADMKKHQSRLFLEITHVAVKRLHQVTEEDCIKHGIGSPLLRDCKKPTYLENWVKQYGQDSVDQNPWIWLIDFQVI